LSIEPIIIRFVGDYQRSWVYDRVNNQALFGEIFAPLAPRPAIVAAIRFVASSPDERSDIRG
jgi:hypothetical protein